MRWIFLLLVCFTGAGLYRGWLSFSGPSRDSDSNKVNVTISVDTDRLQSDIAAAKQRVDAAIVKQKEPSETAAAATSWVK